LPESPQIKASKRALFQALAIFAISALVFSLFAFDRITKPSTDPHFAYLAVTLNSMIAASLGNEGAKNRRKDRVSFELEKHPPHGNDWASYEEIRFKDGTLLKGTWLDKKRNGRFRLFSGDAMVLGPKELIGSKTKKRYFMSFPPGPSFVMMPLALVFDYKINDVILTVFFASFNVALIFLLLVRLTQMGRSRRTTKENMWLTLLFGFGTAHLWLSVMGQVWFTALIMGASFTLLFLYFSLELRRPFLAGIFAAMAFSTRTPLLFACILFYLFLFFPEGKIRKGEWSETLKKGVWFTIPCLAMGLFLLYTNTIRFESPTEFGHSYLAGGGLDRIKNYGLFNFHFLSKNLAALFTLLPRFQPDSPYVIVSKHGMSLLFASPAFFYLLAAKKHEDAKDIFLYRALWLTVICIAIPHLLYQNTGYEQFSYRFSLDYTPYLILLLAIGDAPIKKGFKSAILFGVAVNAFGAIVFKRFSIFFSNGFFP